jgi:hypothetical protein
MKDWLTITGWLATFVGIVTLGHSALGESFPCQLRFAVGLDQGGLSLLALAGWWSGRCSKARLSCPT